VVGRVTGTARAPAAFGERAAAPRRHWSDLAGSAAFCALAVWTMTGAPRLWIALIPVFAYELAFAAAFLIRGRARSTLSGAAPRVAAYAGTFLVPLFLAVAPRTRPDLVAPVTRVVPGAAHVLVPLGALFILAGSLLSSWGLWYLRGSVSLVPAARGLVTTGPYALARHPLYAAYLLSYIGLLLQHPTAPLALVLALWLAFTLARIHYEEAVLEQVFPEYDHYRARVGAFGPRITSIV
jgi:protein-S-isoprenylcysteine O-methyltransferase Ste14